MLDQSVQVAKGRGDTSWQRRARKALGPCARDLARKLAPGVKSDRLVLHLVKARRDALCLRADLGRRTLFLKIFDGPATDASRAYQAEKSVLGAMAATGLVPQLLAFHDASGILVLDHIDGFTFEQVEATACPVDFAEAVGTWVAKFESRAPHRPDSGNWADYLGKLKPMPDLDAFAQDLHMLRGIPIVGSAISRNDPALHNFILRTSGGIVGCDFANARFRPRGWEFVLTYQALLQRFPDQAAEVLSAFERGFASAHTGALQTAEIREVARFLIRAMALAGHDDDVQRIA